MDASAPDDPLYARLAYSTLTGPTREGDPADNHVGLVVAGGVTERGRVEPLGAGEDWAASAHVPTTADGPVPGTRIASISVVRGPYEVRVHHVQAPAGTRVRETGWAPASSVPGELRSTVDGVDARVETGSVRGTLTGALGYDRAAVSAAPQGTAFGSSAAIPFLEGTATGGLFASVLTLTWADRAEGGAPRVVEAESGAEIVWGDDRATRLHRDRDGRWSVHHAGAGAAGSTRREAGSPAR